MKENFSPPPLEEGSLFYTEERKADSHDMLVRCHTPEVSNFYNLRRKNKFTQLQVLHYVLGS